MSSYGSEAGADTYHADRGNDAWAALDSAAKQVAMVRGTDYIDQYYRTRLSSGRWESLFCGEKSDPAQFREWPRTVGDPTPVDIEYASYEAALREAVNPGSLLPDFSPVGDSGAVTQETVGEITVKYADLSKNIDPGDSGDHRPPNMPVIPVIDSLVSPYLCAVASSQVGIVTV